jgi:hypothetical protein
MILFLNGMRKRCEGEGKKDASLVPSKKWTGISSRFLTVIDDTMFDPDILFGVIL